eukprot:7656746-Pyramimonas_sp.AAC.1
MAPQRRGEGSPHGRGRPGEGALLLFVLVLDLRACLPGASALHCASARPAAGRLLLRGCPPAAAA